MALVYSASGATTAGETSLSLYEGPPRAAGRSNDSLRGRPAEKSPSGDRRTIDYRWNLEEFKLLPGTQLAFYAAATDYRGQTGRSELRTLTILAADQLQDLLGQRLGKISTGVGSPAETSARNAQRRPHRRTPPPQNGRSPATNVDLLQSAEFTQREIARGLTDRDEGVSAIAISNLADLQINRIDNPECARRMQGLWTNSPASSASISSRSATT